MIEPIGLGHPTEVLAILSGEYYREVLNLQATLSLVDARKINDPRYTSNDTFNQQIEIAEVVIANKADLYHYNDFPLLVGYVDKNFGLEQKQIYESSQDNPKPVPRSPEVQFEQTDLGGRFANLRHFSLLYLHMPLCFVI